MEQRHTPDGELFAVLDGRHKLHAQSLRRSLTHVDRKPSLYQIRHTSAMILVLMADNTGIKGRKTEAGKLLELFAGASALQKNAGFFVTDYVGITMGGAG